MSENLWAMSIQFFLPEDDDAVIWRGPRKYSAIREMLAGVDWGDLDCLVVDAPPGTGDEALALVELLGAGTGAVIVSTPQRVAVSDVRKALGFCTALELPVLGVIENMSGFVCPHCGETTDIFLSGGAETMAADAGVPFLGRIPMDPAVVAGRRARRASRAGVRRIADGGGVLGGDRAPARADGAPRTSRRHDRGALRLGMSSAVGAPQLVYGPVPSRRLGRSLGVDLEGVVQVRTHEDRSFYVASPATVEMLEEERS